MVLAAIHDVIADAVPDRDMLVWDGARRTLRRGRRPLRGLAGLLVDRVDRGSIASDRRARAVGVRPGPGRPRHAQPPRVHRVDARLLPGPGRPVQRQPPLHAGRDRDAVRHDRGRRGRSTSARSARWSADAVGGTGRCVLIDVDDGSGVAPLEGSIAFEDAVARRPRRDLPVAVARRPLPRLHRRHHRRAQGRPVAAGRHLRLRRWAAARSATAESLARALRGRSRRSGSRRRRSCTRPRSGRRSRASTRRHHRPARRRPALRRGGDPARWPSASAST